MEIRQAVLIGWLAVWTVQDIKRRELVTWQLGAALAAGFFWRISGGDLFGWDMAGVLLLGAISLGCAPVSGGRLGLGDGAVLLNMGVYLGAGMTLTALSFALILTVPVALYLMVCLHRPGSFRIPFVPFLLAGTGVVLLLV